jgi:aminoglycoside 6'-N-acetyltransferase I
MPKHRIRQAWPKDKASWARLRRALWPDCSERKHRLEICQVLGSEGVVFVAENGSGKLVGFAEVSLRRDHVDGAESSPVPYLEGWFVEARYRKRGIGGSLIGAVEKWATARGYTELASDAEQENLLSIRLHKQLGFSEIDRNVTFLKKLRPLTRRVGFRYRASRAD